MSCHTGTQNVLGRKISFYRTQSVIPRSNFRFPAHISAIVHRRVSPVRTHRTKAPDVGYVRIQRPVIRHSPARHIRCQLAPLYTWHAFFARVFSRKVPQHHTMWHVIDHILLSAKTNLDLRRTLVNRKTAYCQNLLGNVDSPASLVFSCNFLVCTRTSRPSLSTVETFALTDIAIYYHQVILMDCPTIHMTFWKTFSPSN